MMMVFIDAHREDLGIEPICRELAVAPSSYHEHVARLADPGRRPTRAQRDDEMLPALYRSAGQQLTRDGLVNVLQGSCYGGSTVINAAVGGIANATPITVTVGGDSVALTIFQLQAAGGMMRVMGQYAAALLLLWVEDAGQVPFVKLVGGALLIWIGMKLLAPGDEDEHGNLEGAGNLMGAIKTVIVADLVMSIDNVIAIAGAAQQADPDHQLGLVIFGLLVSIPLIVWGSQIVLRLIDRFPVVVLAGGALLGWIAGGMMITDIFIEGYIGEVGQTVTYACSIIGAVLVVALGKLMARKQRKAMEA